MKQSEIQVGKCYTDKKGKIRKVIDIDYPRYKTDTPYVTFEHESAWKGKAGEMWLPYFARWAKAEVECPETPGE